MFRGFVVSARHSRVIRLLSIRPGICGSRLGRRLLGGLWWFRSLPGGWRVAHFLFGGSRLLAAGCNETRQHCSGGPKENLHVKSHGEVNPKTHLVEGKQI